MTETMHSKALWAAVDACRKEFRMTLGVYDPRVIATILQPALAAMLTALEEPTPEMVEAMQADFTNRWPEVSPSREMMSSAFTAAILKAGASHD